MDKLLHFSEVFMKNKVKFSQKQLDKIADQFRILSWAQGAIVNYLQLPHDYVTMTSIILSFCIFQSIASYLERDKNG